MTSRIATETYADDPAKAREIRRMLLEREGMSWGEVRSCIAELQSQPDLWQPFWKSVREYTQSQGGTNGREPRRTDRRQF